MREYNHEWYLRIEGDERRYPIEYRIYHLLRGNNERITLYEVEYQGRTSTKRNLEDAVKDIGKFIRKRKEKIKLMLDREEMDR